MDRRPTVVEQVHRHLNNSAALQRDGKCADIPEPATDASHCTRNFFSDVESVRGQLDVEGDQGHPCSNNADAGRWVNFFGTEIWSPAWFLDFPGEILEAARSDRGQLTPRGVAGGVLVQIDGELEVFRNFPPHPLGQSDAVTHLRAAKRNERDHIHSADPG